MLLLIKCKYRILEKFKPPHKKPTENGDIHADKSGESDGLIEGEEKAVVDMDMEIDPKVSNSITHYLTVMTISYWDVLNPLSWHRCTWFYICFVEINLTCVQCL